MFAVYAVNFWLFSKLVLRVISSNQHRCISWVEAEDGSRRIRRACYNERQGSGAGEPTAVAARNVEPHGNVYKIVVQTKSKIRSMLTTRKQLKF